jgi:PAS domain S-box-containing protein
MTSRNDDVDLTQEGMKAKMLELIRANEALKQALVRQQTTIDSLKKQEKKRLDGAPLMAQWYWELDEKFCLSKLSPAANVADKQGQNLLPGLGGILWEIDSIPGNRPVFERYRKRLENHETFLDVRDEWISGDGQTYAISVSGESVADAAGNFRGYRGVACDVTDKQPATLSLQSSDSRLRSIVNALAEGVILRDVGGRIVECNASAERIIGKTSAMMKGQLTFAPEWQTLHEDGSLMQVEGRPSTVARRTGLAQSNVVVGYQKPDGSILWALLNARPLFDGGSDTPTGFVTTVTDISQRMKAEREIVRLNVDLERRVSRRTSELEAVNKELEAFSYSVAHDLRSPLSSIDGYSALLQKAVSAESDAHALHCLSRIRSAAQHMGELTDGLLSLAHLSRTSLELNTVSLSDEATSIIRQLSEDEPTRSLHATVEPGLLVHADRALLRQVLQNLIANACKFSSKKESTKIIVGREMDANQQPVYFVRDHGAGFDMAYADKLFGTFQRLHSPEEFSGSGIGLATVKRIISRHGGSVWANSVLGEGSTFYFTLRQEQGDVTLAGTDEHLRGVTLSQYARQQWLQEHSGKASVGLGPEVSNDDCPDDGAFGSQLFSNAFEHSATGMTVIDPDVRRLKVNNAFCKMLGYSEAEMLSRTIYELSHPDDIEADLAQRQRALAGEIEAFQFEKRYIHKSGSTVWGYVSTSLLRDVDRKPLYFIRQVQDITERKKSDRILKANEERFRELTELSSDWFWEQDEEFRFQKIVGEPPFFGPFTGNNLLGKTRWEVDYLDMDVHAMAAHKAQLERHEAFHNFAVSWRGQNGKIRHMSLSGVPVFHETGHFAGYWGIGRDNTEMRRVADALSASQALLREIHVKPNIE